MSNCKWCDAKIFWTQERSVMGEVWRAYEDEDCTKRHQCENYKPKSKGKKAVEEEAKRQRDKEWGAAKLDIQRWK